MTESTVRERERWGLRLMARGWRERVHGELVNIVESFFRYLNRHKWHAECLLYHSPDAKEEKRWLQETKECFPTHPVTTMTASPVETKPRSLARWIASMTRASTSSNQSLMAKACAEEMLCCLNITSLSTWTSSDWRDSRYIIEWCEGYYLSRCFHQLEET